MTHLRLGVGFGPLTWDQVPAGFSSGQSAQTVLGSRDGLGWGFGSVVLILTASSVSQNQVPAQQGQGSEASGHPAKDLVGGVNWNEVTSLCTDAPLEASQGA